MQQETANHEVILQTHTPPILNVARRLELLHQETTLADQLDWCGEIAELEDEITSSPATSLSEAAVQVMLASAYIERVREDLVEDTDAVLAKLEQLIRSALAAFLRETGIDLTEFGGKRYLPSQTEAPASNIFRN
ncbi:MAG: hypothetical protein OEM59_23050 [Rhodospirillales bacterium]|nr:hypothetical protein [Rhodospirillales bacterium]